MVVPKHLVTVSLFFLLFYEANTQEERLPLTPQIGRPIPSFILENIQYYPVDKVSNEMLKGKWVILDFFSKYCSSCFASFPKINELNREFKGKVEIILVGSTRNVGYGEIQRIYEKFRKGKGLELPVAYDSTLFKQWNIRFVPFTIWINPQGIVKAVTTSTDLTRENLQSFINDAPFDFSDRSLEEETKKFISYTYKKPLLVDGNGGTEDDLLYRSILANWSPKVQQSIPSTIRDFLAQISSNRFQLTGATLEWLYEFAYCGGENGWNSNYGKIYHLPILKIRDSSSFKFDFKTGKNLFNYSVTVPLEKASSEYIMKIMQKDLSSYFGYEASFEEHLVPYWALKLKDESCGERLRSMQKESVNDIGHAGGRLANVPVKRVIRKISGYHQGMPPIIDETGIDFNIDLNLDALLTDFEDVQKALEKQGLILEKGVRVMPALIIKDPKPETIK